MANIVTMQRTHIVISQGRVLSTIFLLSTPVRTPPKLSVQLVAASMALV